ncbi:MAG: tetratricopeptide repeat protein [Aggregatilineales bacterium]
MSDTPRTQLERAFHLIQEERLDEALGVLRPFLDNDPNNADGWWLYANAVSDPSQARQALETVLRLNPKHPEAHELLNQLNEAAPAGDTGFGDLNLADPFAGLRPSDKITDEPVGGMALDDPFAEAGKTGGLFDEDAVPSFVAEGGAKPPRDFTVDNDEALLTGLAAASTPAGAKTSASATIPGMAPTSTMQRRRSPVLLGLMGLLVILLVVLGGLLLAQKLAIAPSSTITGTALAVLPTAQNGVTAVATAAATFNVTAPVVVTTAPISSAATQAVSSAPTSNATTEATASLATAPPVVASAPTSAANATAAGTAAAAPGDAMNAAQQQVTAQFAANGLTNPKAAIDTSSLGQTLTVSFCSPFGPQLTNKVNQAMDTLAAQAVTVSDQVQAISVEVYNCVNASQLEFKAVSPIEDVLAYINKTATARQFRAGWKLN